MSDMVLELSNISHDYQQGRSIIEILNNINLTINKGEHIAITGASGSGKTTLLQIAGLLQEPTEGIVKLAGQDIDFSVKKDLAHLRAQHIGFIYQFHHLLKDCSALENVAMPLIIQRVKYKEATEQATGWLEKLGLGKRLLNLPGQLSGGEQQRVSIARAMIAKPSIILADEPTGNLDNHTAEEVMALLRECTKAQKIAMLIVTHDLKLAQQMDKIYNLTDTQLILK